MHSNETIMSYIYNELSKKEQKQFEAHMKECTECRNTVNEMKKTLGIVDSLNTVSAPKGLTEEIISEYTVSLHTNSDIMTAAELAAYLKVDLDAVYELLDDIPYLNLAGRIRFKKESVDHWLAMREQNSFSVEKSPAYEDISPKLWRGKI